MLQESDRVFQGIWIPRMIYLNRDVCWSAKILFLEIHSFTSNGQQCFMSNEYISKFLGLSKRQVSRHITELKNLGWIIETGFDGRKRFLESCLVVSFSVAKTGWENDVVQHRHKSLSRNDDNVYSGEKPLSKLTGIRGQPTRDTNVYHNKPSNKQDYFFKGKEKKSKGTILE